MISQSCVYETAVWGNVRESAMEAIRNFNQGHLKAISKTTRGLDTVKRRDCSGACQLAVLPVSECLGVGKGVGRIRRLVEPSS
jgi:hypothetical protein